MKYMVVLYDEFIGLQIDDYSKIFNNEERAKRYCQDLNIELAIANMCFIEDLGEYYVVKEIKED